ncbi:DUF7285 family protein [Halobaculum sp. EA56]|uniref:DUF7285 family protein n=1 Tax=Halobaculum sp. EA56 TaxID=3421648 RepID=UPI003EBB3C8B
MSRSSSSRERGQAEPTVALAAVLALSFGLAAYAAVLGGVDAVTGPSAGPTLERVHEGVTVGGVADPDRLADATERAGADALEMNATLTAAGRRWSAGESPPTGGAGGTASRATGVALAPGRVRPGTLSVTVWR